MPSAASDQRNLRSTSAWRRLPRRVTHFWLSPDSALNLGLLRVATFALLFGQLLSVDGRYALDSAALIAAALATVGCLTPVSTWVAIVLSAIALEVRSASPLAAAPLFVAAVVAAARSADAISIDALWRAVRRADRGIVRPLPRSARYGIPLRMAMMVLGLAYLLEARVATPAVAPWLAVFALALPVAVLWTPTRLAWAAIGFSGHLLGPALKSAGRQATAALYVMFVDWQRLAASAGRRLFGEGIVVLYDGNCRMCRRTMNLLLACDWLAQLRPVSGFDRDRIEALGLGDLSDEALMRDMHAGEQIDQAWRITKGYDAYQRIAWRVPLLWPTLLVAYLPPVAAVGRRTYRHVADTRACAVPISQDTAAGSANRRQWIWLALVVPVVLILQLAHGLGWP